MERYRILLSLTAVVTALTLGACGDAEPTGSGGGFGPVPTAAAGDSGGGAAIDACTLFTAEELTEVLGQHERQQWGGTGESSCQWGNAEGSTVSIDIDREGSAPGGEVPPDEVMAGEAEPGADGLTYYPMGYVTFPVDDRACRLQIVVTLGDPMADRPAIDRFAGLVRERL